MQVPPDRAQLRLRRLVSLSFPLAWAIHDVEEVLTAGRWQRLGPSAIRQRFPSVPDGLIQVATPAPRQMLIAVGIVGAGVVAVSGITLVDLAAAQRDGLDQPAGRPSKGQLRLLQAALAAFTAHGVSHLGSSAVLRAYTPGVFTVPLVIAPYSVWAWRTLRASGLRLRPGELLSTLAIGAAMALPLVFGAQGIGRLSSS